MIEQFSEDGPGGLVINRTERPARPAYIDSHAENVMGLMMDYGFTFEQAHSLVITAETIQRGKEVSDAGTD